MARETPPKTVTELVELPSSNLCVTSIGAAIFILMLNHVDVIGDQSDAVTQNAWFRCVPCAAISGEISILMQTGEESWGRFPVPRICHWESSVDIIRSTSFTFPSWCPENTRPMDSCFQDTCYENLMMYGGLYQHTRVVCIYINIIIIIDASIKC